MCNLYILLYMIDYDYVNLLRNHLSYDFVVQVGEY